MGHVARSSFAQFKGLLFAFALVLVLSGGVRGEAFQSYQYIGTFSVPASSSMFDALPDGRVVALSGADVYLESAPASGSFSLHGTLPDADLPSFGAAFLRVSSDGTKLAVGNNGGATFGNYRVGVFAVASLTGVWHSALHYDAAWVDNSRLAVTAGVFGDPSYVSVLDTTSPNPNSPDNRTVISGIGGASGGIALDAQGNIFTGNGFVGAGPSDTGVIKAFLDSSWEAAYTGGTPINFETQGMFIVDVLSASPMAFDGEGNLLVGGGDFSLPAETDHVALIRASAIAGALGGGGPVNANDPTQVRRLDPDAPNDFNFYYASTSPSMGRVYAKDLSESTVHVYLDITNMPAASTWGMINFALLVSIAGSLALHRRVGGGVG